MRYTWIGWEAETDLGNADDRENVHYLTILEDGEEFAIIVHRSDVDPTFWSSKASEEKLLRAQRICDALNAQEGAGQ